MVYPLMAATVSMALNSRPSRRAESLQGKKMVVAKASFSLCIALLTLYSGGTAWLIFTAGYSLRAALILTVYPFIPLDILKIVFCIVVIVPLRSRILLYAYNN